MHPHLVPSMPLQLSVVIVNYNVKYFLLQALKAAQKACIGLQTEIWVVDNASSDGSVEYLTKHFPDVRLIANTQNMGFAKANNQALGLCQGQYVLLLNPDTVVEEDSFHKCIAFMTQNPVAGALGVKMIDGKGHFLPESKRALPTPKVAFYKMSGLSALFPSSKHFGLYHLTYLDYQKTHEVDVLSGAFMLVRNAVMQQVGYLDETYFMYGEDIDLSYSIQRAGFKNFYFADTTIIHYKGESTKKQTINYVVVFYRAMILFAQKYFKTGRAMVFSYLINVAIMGRAVLQIAANILKKTLSPLLDALIVFLGMYFLKEFWQSNIKIEEGTIYPPFYMQTVVPFYVFVWLSSAFFSGAYDTPIKLTRLIRGILFGTLVISAVYGFFDENIRYSRGLILAGTGVSVALTVGLRLLVGLLSKRNSRDIFAQSEKNMVILGGFEESNRLLALLQQANIKARFIGFLSQDTPTKTSEFYLGTFEHLSRIVEATQANELIFCGKDVSNKTIIKTIEGLKNSHIDFKILPSDSDFIIGSNSVEYPGDLYTPDFNLAIAKPSNIRNKRVIDVVVALVLVMTLPMLVFFYRHKRRFVGRVFGLLAGHFTLVAYNHYPNQLPKIKQGILHSLTQNAVSDVQNIAFQKRVDVLYAKYYSAFGDIKILFRQWRNLDK